MYEDIEIAVEMVELLIENGANVNLSTSSGRRYYEKYIHQYSTALHIATKFEKDVLVDYLLKNGAILDHQLIEDESEPVHSDDEDEEALAQLALLEKYSNYPTPERDPSAYHLTEKEVKYLFSMSNNVTWEKCMPLVVYNKINSDITVTNDVILLIVQIYKNMSLFW
ncbi:MAG: hypothetical protein H0T62_13290 [Parachlamydiaceae bacterium]|nr:hypothetical protein [Parachlamydiaceae bacterium]